MVVAAEGRVEGPDGRRKVARFGGTCYIRITRGIQRNARAIVAIAASQVGGVKQGGRTRWIELRHKGIIIAAIEDRVEGPDGRRKVTRFGGTYYIRISGSIQRNTRAVVAIAASQVGGVD
jgi:hypothetical protein